MNPAWMPMARLFASLIPEKKRTTPETLVEAYLQRLGLTRQQALSLRGLSTEPGWRALLAALDNIISLRAEEMLRISHTEDLHFQRGRITGLREVPNLVAEILTRLEDLEQTDDRKHKHADLTDDPTRVATFGTPAWKR